MLGRRANTPDGGAAEQGEIIAFHRFGHTETAMPSRVFATPKLFLATTTSAADDDEVAVPEHAEGVMNPTSILSGGPVPSSRGGSSGGDRRSKGKSRSTPWEARPVGLGLASALNGEATGASTTILNGQTLRPAHTINAPSRSPSPAAASNKEFGVNSCRNPAFAQLLKQYTARCRCLSPSEMEASEDYTRVIARRPNPTTVHIFDDHVGVDSGWLSAGSGEGEFLRWCHSCGKDLGQGKDIFMYKGEMAFCSYDCRHREMLFDEKF